jgi:uncharacterized protein (TIGR03435 family)
MRIIRISAGAILLMCSLVAWSAASAQSTAPAPSFDVASIKLHEGGAHIIDISSSGSRLNVQAEMARGLITYAYNVEGYQVVLTPALSAFGDKSYDIVAEVDGSRVPTTAEFREMLKSLLTDRFKLTAHHEQREMPVYALVVGANGPKFKQSAPDEKFSGFMGVNGRNENMTMTDAAMAEIARSIRNFTDRPVVDKTGLTGTYDIKFKATPEFRIENSSDPHDISIFDAVVDQLGLKLQSEKDMVDVIVVDHIEAPTPN